MYYRSNPWGYRYTLTLNVRHQAAILRMLMQLFTSRPVISELWAAAYSSFARRC
jgi:hypothetical protein